MKNYVVGCLNIFNDEIFLKKVEANSEVEAIMNSGFVYKERFPEDVDIETIKKVIFDCNSAISVIEV